MKKGFTLVEILIVVVIAVSVAAFSVPAYKKAQEKARYNAAAGFLAQLGTAVKNMRADLQLEGTNTLFPVDSSVLQLSGDWTDSSKDAYTTVRDAAKVSDFSTNDNLGYALVARNYMPKYPFIGSGYNGYAFYICPQDRTSVSDCCAGGVVVCMQNSDSTNYHMGRFFDTGIITSYAK